MDRILFLGGPRDRDIVHVADSNFERGRAIDSYTRYEIQLFDDSQHAPVKIAVMLLTGADPCMYYDTIRTLRFDDRFANLFTPYCGPGRPEMCRG